MIWRYIGFDKFESLIKDESLFFCRADKLKEVDQLEGTFPDKMIKKFKLDNNQFPSEDGNTYSNCSWQNIKEARSHLINCWHVNDKETSEMWKKYTKNNQSFIAIQSTLERLKNCLNANSERIWIGEIEYIDFSKWEPRNRLFNGGQPNTLNTFFLKQNSLEYEKEIRAVINKAFIKHQARKGILVKVDISKLIECIYFCKKEDKKRIDAILTENNFSFPKEKSKLGTKLL